MFLNFHKNIKKFFYFYALVVIFSVQSHGAKIVPYVEWL